MNLFQAHAGLTFVVGGPRRKVKLGFGPVQPGELNQGHIRIDRMQFRIRDMLGLLCLLACLMGIISLVGWAAAPLLYCLLWGALTLRILGNESAQCPE